MLNLEHRKSAVEKLLKSLGQEHVLRFWPELNEHHREALLAQTEDIDYADLARRIEMFRAGGISAKFSGHLTAPEYVALPQNPAGEGRFDNARHAGEELIGAGKIGIVMVAGGQGSRLGYEHPKGMYPIGPVTDRSLFQLHAEKIIARGKRAGGRIPWSIMTSETTHEETVAFFREKKFFGIAESDVMFFQQEMIPAIDRNGKLILAGKHQIFMNPNGHGGTLKAMKDEGVLDWFAAKGVTDAYYFQVDNAGLEVADPAFLGFHAMAEADMSNKALMKIAPEDKLGNYGIIEGKLSVIEYSDFDPELAKLRDANGQLVYRLGSPAVHILNLDFVRRLNEGVFALPYHVAEKSVQCINENGELVTPKEKNGIKFETFIFDALPLTRQWMILEMSREREWAPVKNATGIESPGSTREFLTEMYAAWLESAGVKIPRAAGKSKIKIEISPVFALDAAELKSKLNPKSVDPRHDIAIGPNGPVK
jgi:UDP-N-acetylglucosamine/UDP-N-acetylgalactosamine diphosphorylase